MMVIAMVPMFSTQRDARLHQLVLHLRMDAEQRLVCPAAVVATGLPCHGLGGLTGDAEMIHDKYEG